MPIFPGTALEVANLQESLAVALAKIQNLEEGIEAREGVHHAAVAENVQLKRELEASNLESRDKERRIRMLEAQVAELINAKNNVPAPMAVENGHVGNGVASFQSNRAHLSEYDVNFRGTNRLLPVFECAFVVLARTASFTMWMHDSIEFCRPTKEVWL